MVFGVSDFSRDRGKAIQVSVQVGFPRMTRFFRDRKGFFGWDTENWSPENGEMGVDRVILVSVFPFLRAESNFTEPFFRELRWSTFFRDEKMAIHSRLAFWRDRKTANRSQPTLWR